MKSDTFSACAIILPGSLAATLTGKELNEWFRAYVLGQPLDAYTNKLAGSSVMEYKVFKARAFQGWRMRTLKEPLPHDRAAIRWGYFDSPEARTNKLLFATDDDTMEIRRCARLRLRPGTGRRCLLTDMAQIIDLLPNNVIERFIRARAPQNPRDRIPLERSA